MKKGQGELAERDERWYVLFEELRIFRRRFRLLSREGSFRRMKFNAGRADAIEKIMEIMARMESSPAEIGGRPSVSD